MSSTYVFDLNMGDQFSLARLVMLDGVWFPKPDRDLCQGTSLEVFDTSVSAQQGSLQGSH